MEVVVVLLCVSGFVLISFFLINELKKSVDKKYGKPDFVTNSEVKFTRLNYSRRKIILKPKITRLR